MVAIHIYTAIPQYLNFIYIYINIFTLNWRKNSIIILQANMVALHIHHYRHKSSETKKSIVHKVD